jgi:hypothetical protein
MLFILVMGCRSKCNYLIVVKHRSIKWGFLLKNVSWKLMDFFKPLGLQNWRTVTSTVDNDAQFFLHKRFCGDEYCCIV